MRGLSKVYRDMERLSCIDLVLRARSKAIFFISRVFSSTMPIAALIVAILIRLVTDVS